MRSAVLLLILLAGCNGGRGRATADAGPPHKGDVAIAAPPDRPYGLHVPLGWSRATPAPLVVFFHGYGSTGAGSAQGFGLPMLSDANGFVLAFPDGTVDAQGRRFWNATDACCDFGDTHVDDVAYASWLIDDVEGKLPIDPKRVYVVGHSNGAFLALRLACDLSTRVAAAVSLAGAAWKDPSRCKMVRPVSVLLVQGDADGIVHYGGGVVFDKPDRPYPGTLASVATMATADGCAGALAAPGAPLDFDGYVPGAETTRAQVQGCPPGISVSLWTVAGGSHAPSPTPDGLAAIWGWMAAHPKL